MTKEPWIVIKGNPVEGFSFYGPFSSNEEANAYIDEMLSDVEAWTYQLIAPVPEPEELPE